MNGVDRWTRSVCPFQLFPFCFHVPVWMLVAQVLVDLDRFPAAIDDFNKAESLQAENYVSLGLLSNRALAYEGIYDFKVAADCGD